MPVASRIAPTLDEEKAAVAAHLAGNKAATSKLHLWWKDQVSGIAQQWLRRLYHSKSARIELDDLVGEAWVIILRKLPDYDMSSEARPLSWLHRWIEAACKHYCCNNLEILPAGNDSQNHAAHRELEQGGDPEEIAKRRGMSRERVQSLERHTVGIDAARLTLSGAGADVYEDEQEDNFRARIAADTFASLGYHQRMALAGQMAGLSDDELHAVLLRGGIPREAVRTYVDGCVADWREKIERQIDHIDSKARARALLATLMRLQEHRASC